VNLQGYVLAAAVVMLLVYALPALADRRRLMAASRLEDRHSDRLRVLATVGDGGRRGRDLPGHLDRDADTVAGRPTAPALLPIGPEQRAMSTISPRLSEPARRARDLAHSRSQRAARMSRRNSARRRRLMYQVALGLLTIGGWIAVGSLGWTVAAGIVPTVLLAGVIARSVRASIEARTLNRIDVAEIRRIEGELRQLSRRPKDRAADDADAHQGADEAAPAGAGDVRTADDAVGRESRPVDAGSRTWATVAGERITAPAEEPPAREVVHNDVPDAWTPVPVPSSRWAEAERNAPRGTTPRVTTPAYEAPEAPSARVPLRPTKPSYSGAVVAGSGADAPPIGAPSAPLLDLDAALERRRARGA
jgi:hypothetical protein